MCDKPPSTSRACTKMYLAANGQSSRRLSYSIAIIREAQPVPPVIPQTGQLWWPVPVLGILGLDFLALGLVLRKK